MKSSNHLQIERGILTSAYKKEIRENIRYMKADSLSRIKETIANHAASSANNTAAILRVSFIMLSIIIFAI